MTDSAAARTLLDVGEAVTDLTTRITDVAAPGLGAWDVAGLAGHLLRALRTPITYLDRAPASSVAHGDGAAYFVAYLERRDADAAATDASVAARGADELAVRDPDAITAAYREAIEDLRARLADADPDFVVDGPFGGIALDAYLETRIFEATVHGLDLATALGHSDWQPPASALAVSLRLLSELALRRGRAAELLRALTGRSPGDLAPILQ